MPAKHEFVFAPGTGIGITVVTQADNTVLVTVTNTAPGGGSAFGADVANPGVAGGAGQVLPGAPHGWREISPTSGEWVPYWTLGT